MSQLQQVSLTALWWLTHFLSVLLLLQRSAHAAEQLAPLLTSIAQPGAVVSAVEVPSEVSEAQAPPSSVPVPVLPTRCTAGCTTSGTCHEELGRCDCPRHLTGANCSAEVEDVLTVCSKYGFSSGTCQKIDGLNCVNACNFRGKCWGGFCHCMPGYFGADCSLSLNKDGKPELLAGQNYTVRSKGPRIYVYELPPSLNTWYNVDRMDRPLHLLFWQRLLSAGVRTANPDEADYFFIPVKARMAYDSENVKKAVMYVQETWPHWNRTQGDRHLLMHTGDWGRDEVNDEAKFMTRNCTWLTHWGLARDHQYAGWTASHRPGKDIVIPIFLQHALVLGYNMRRSPLHPSIMQKTRAKTLFFAGRVCGNRKEPLIDAWPNCGNVLGHADGYSAGTRQRVHYHHHNRTGFKITTTSRTYPQDLITSKFCLAPTGGGHGKRSVLVSMMGCIPVTVTDGVLQPFEPEIHWDQFAIDIRERDIPNMHQVLEELSPSQIGEFQTRLHCAAQHLFWSSVYGSLIGEDGRYDAFETIMEILRMRLKYPEMSPEEYAFNDDDFQNFMDCESGPAKDPPDLCTHAEVASTALPCMRCSRRRGKLLAPGGSICCNTRELAKCPRLWE